MKIIRVISKGVGNTRTNFRGIYCVKVCPLSDNVSICNEIWWFSFHKNYWVSYNMMKIFNPKVIQLRLILLSQNVFSFPNIN